MKQLLRMFIFLLILDCQSINVYFGGSIFTLQDISGNQLLANAIERLSNNKYQVLLPQKFRIFPRDKKIRDEDLKMLLAADVGLFNFNGPDVDSGTVVEYMFAKFTDKPAVILRTDSRNDQCEGPDQPFNLLLRFYPRTENLIVNILEIYNENNHRFRRTLDHVANRIIKKLDEVLQTAPLLNGQRKQAVNKWVEKLIESK